VLARTSHKHDALLYESLAGLISESSRESGKCQLSQSPNSQSHVDQRETFEIGTLRKSDRMQELSGCGNGLELELGLSLQ
jgi:hypothetical protein